MPLGTALLQRALRPGSPNAAPFIEWFINLFGLQEHKLGQA